jgi:phosphoglycolate phosphatase-like HAD superfamily hydrolase
MLRPSSVAKLLLILVLSLAVGAVFAPGVASAPLPSWNDGPTREAILAFVAAVTDPDSPDFVPEPERVAVFDNDGTSWCERPHYPSSRFQRHLLGTLVDAGRVDGQAMPFSAWLANDRDRLREFGWSEAYTAMNAQFAGMPVEAYRDSVRAFLARERHPRYGLSYPELYYTPMRELKALLEENGFQVWIVTGSPQDFVRAFVEDAFGVPPERMIGTWTRPQYGENGTVSMTRGAVQVSNGYENKPANIELRIGRRPLVSVGNSNNDASMGRWTLAGERRSLVLWIHHDDAAREYDYDRGTSRIARLVQEHADAHEVSMARDWGRLFDHE